MNGLLFHLVGPHHYAQMTGLLSGEEMRQGPVYLQCTDDDDDDDSASLEGHICLKALEEELFLQLACLQTMLNSFPPSSSTAIWPLRYYYYFSSVCLYKIFCVGMSIWE